MKIFRVISVCFFIFQTALFAYTPLRLKSLPSNSIELATLLELHDDVYSNDINAFAEFSLNSQLSFLGELSYRTFSFEQEMDTSFNILHKGTNLSVSGFYTFLLGVKFFPVEFLGASLDWAIPIEKELGFQKFHSVSGEFLFLYPFTNWFEFSLAQEFCFYIPTDNFSLGSEIAIQWQGIFKISKWRIEHISEFRQRVKDSKNKSLAIPYQKQNDRFSALRFKTAIYRNLIEKSFDLDIGISYEVAKGFLYGKETGHKFSIESRFSW